mmetsp:Transcript_119240/g.338088  ORF Transcript_119240/g.338088 Transcript_119240/m.338088 type:complete len:172 (-) Transcript_119240:9-524(-)
MVACRPPIAWLRAGCGAAVMSTSGGGAGHSGWPSRSMDPKPGVRACEEIDIDDELVEEWREEWDEGTAVERRGLICRPHSGASTSPAIGLGLTRSESMGTTDGSCCPCRNGGATGGASPKTCCWPAAARAPPAAPPPRASPPRTCWVPLGDPSPELKPKVGSFGCLEAGCI